MSRMDNPVAKTVVNVVDATALGTPVLFVLGAADLVVTSVTGALYTLVAGGYVLRISSKRAFSSASKTMMANSMLRKRELQRANDSLNSAWELVENDTSDESRTTRVELVDIVEPTTTINSGVDATALRQALAQSGEF